MRSVNGRLALLPTSAAFAGIGCSQPPTLCGHTIASTPHLLRAAIGCMRDDDLRRVLTDANPWWRAASFGTDPLAWIDAHRLLIDRAEHDLGYRASVLDDIASNPRVDDRLVVLTGPRRVGKSVALLDVAAVLCGRPDIDPRQVIHLPCDGFATRDLRRALSLGRELTRVIDHPQSIARVWLLDEVSSIEGWTAMLKSARDGTPFGSDTVVATGSR